MTGFFGNMYDKVVGNSIVPDMVNRIGSEFHRMGGVMETETKGRGWKSGRPVLELLWPESEKPVSLPSLAGRRGLAEEHRDAGGNTPGDYGASVAGPLLSIPIVGPFLGEFGGHHGRGPGQDRRENMDRPQEHLFGGPDGLEQCRAREAHGVPR